MAARQMSEEKAAIKFSQSEAVPCPVRSWVCISPTVSTSQDSTRCIAWMVMHILTGPAVSPWGNESSEGRGRVRREARDAWAEGRGGAQAGRSGSERNGGGPNAVTSRCLSRVWVLLSRTLRAIRVSTSDQ